MRNGPVLIRHILDPLWSKPHLLLRGDPFCVTVRLGKSGVGEPRFSISLVGHGSTLRLRPTGLAEPRRGLFTASCKVPASCPPGLYDLEVDWGNGPDRMPHAVSVHGSWSRGMDLVHLTDPHVSALPGDRSPASLDEAVARINRMAPDLVLLTGDLVSRYTDPAHPVSPDEADRDLRLAQGILLGLRVPLFVTAGNHDLAYPCLRRRFRRYVSRPAFGRRMDYSFHYGGFRFVTFEAFRHYDRQGSSPSWSSITVGQMRWLDRELAEARHSSCRVLFYHYDYSDQLPGLFDRHRVDLALYGHTKPTTRGLIGATPTLAIRDFGIKAEGHFSRIRITPEPEGNAAGAHPRIPPCRIEVEDLYVRSS